jgi:transposase
MYISGCCVEDVCMSEAELVPEVVVVRRRRSAEERRLIVEETLAAGSSVARVARKYGINANQVFQWRRMYRGGQLGGGPQSKLKLLSVTVSDEADLVKPERAGTPVSSPGALHIELPGRALVSVEGSVDLSLVRVVLEALRA